jgi:hypothetical protein
MVFEVNDDIETAGHEWVFRNKKTYGDYAATEPFRISGAGEAYVSGNVVLNASNYTSYAPSLTGSGASGTWGINVTGTSGSISGFNNPTTAATANTIAYRTGDGDIAAREIILSSGLSSSQPTVLVSMFPTTNQLVRTAPSAVANAIRDAASGNWGINVTGNAATATTADQIDGVAFRNTGSNAAVDADTLDSNGITYYTAGVPNFTGNATDGALYSQAYSSSWQHQIAADYRSGQIALRGKNSGTWQSWRTVLDSSNYTSYAPSLTGSGASGTWGISITGNALSSTLSVIQDTRSGALTPNDYSDYRVTYEFTNQVIGGDWHSAITPKGWTDGYAAWQIWGPSSTSAHENWYLRSGINTTWNPLRTILHSGNYGSYALPLAGGTVTGDITMSGTGMIKVPVGTTAQRPGTPALGMIRFNSTRGCYEGYTASGWVNMSPINFDDIGAIA